MTRFQRLSKWLKRFSEDKCGEFPGYPTIYRPKLRCPHCGEFHSAKTISIHMFYCNRRFLEWPYGKKTEDQELPF